MKLETVKVKHNTQEWLDFRKTGIGGSEAAAILGVSHFRTNIDVWEEKRGYRQPEDISGIKAVKYGSDAESPLIKLFALDYPQYKVKVNKNVVYKRGFMFASLDAEITDENGLKGFYEGKTSEIHSGVAMDKWHNQIPEYYYAQILHYFIVTGWDFAVCKAQLKRTGTNGQLEVTTRHYPYIRGRILDDLQYLYLKEKEFWQYVVNDERPPLQLPSFGRN